MASKKQAPASTAPFDPAALYSISIKLSKTMPTADGKTGIAFKNITGEVVHKMRKSIFTEGVPYVMPETGTIQLIHPMAIDTIFIIPQKEGKI